MKDLKSRVLEAFANANGNEYLFEGWTAEMIAEDMVSFAPDLEDEDSKEITAILRESGLVRSTK